MELGASIFVCELPFDGNGILVLLIQVVLHFATQFLGRADMRFQATSDQEPDFNFCHVQLASMLRCVVKFKSLTEAPPVASLKWKPI